ncbi:MAG TPA: alpha-2-macroglobulin family protein, partial [Myxococcota bacterium]
PVATRTFKIEAYRLPTFELQLTGASRVRLDQPFTMRASARYYAGGNVADQPIRWNVSRRAAWHTPAGREGFLFASSSQFARPEATSKPEQTEREGSLDDDGSDTITMNPEKDLDGSPRVYRFEATVTGADDQEVSSVTEVLALPPFSLGMKLDRFKKTATTIAPEIIAVGVDDKLVAGQQVTVRLFKRTWHSHLRESHFATGEANYVTEQEDKKLLEQTATTTTSPLAVTLPVQGAGVYVVELSAKDKLGRVQTLSADLYIGGKEPVSWQKGTAGVFELVPDKRAHKPGETANVVVKSPFANAKGLLVIERGTGNEYRPFEVDNGSATLGIAIDASMTPNLPIHVVLHRGRLGESASDDAAWRPQTMAASLDLEVVPSKQQLKVALKHPAQARPGDTVPITVTLKDDEGRAVGGEVALWLVDEAVLSLAKEGPLDPLTSMIQRNNADSTLYDTRNSVVGRLIEEETPGGDGDDNADGNAAKRRVRKNFQTVPYWQASLVVPASGSLEVNVPLSDDLTTFVVKAVAASGAGRFGNTDSKLKVRLPVIVQPQLPRFVRQGDRFEGGAVARLVEGAGGAGVVKAEYMGPVVERKRSKDIGLVLDKATSVTFPVEVSSAASTVPLKVKMEVLRKSDGVGDAFEVTLPVLPDVPWQRSVSRVELTSTSTALPGPRDAARAGAATQTVVATTVSGLLETVSALEYLEQYPHGCLEQKLAKLAPTLAMASLSAQLGGERYGAAAKPQVDRLLQEFAQHQDDTGLFSLWPGGRGDVQLTALALGFAAEADRQGHTIDTAVIERARAALTSSLRSDASWSSDLLPWRALLTASSLRALSLSGGADDAYLTELLRKRSQLDATGRAELALAVLATGRDTWKSDLASIRSELWSSVTFQLASGQRIVTGISDPRAIWGRRVLGSSTSTLAVVLEALVRLDPTSTDLPLLLDALLRQSRGAVGFGSTWDNRAAVVAIAAYLQHAKPAGRNATVTLGDKCFALDGTTKVARLVSNSEVPTKAMTTSPPTTAQIGWRSLPATTGDRLAADKHGLIVDRSMSVVPVDGSATRRSDDVRAAEQRFEIGDIVELHTRVTSDEARYSVVVVVPFAAGFEPLNPTLANAPAEATPTEQDS